MKEEDFIFNDEPLCNEDDLIDYNKRQASLNYRKLQYIMNHDKELGYSAVSYTHLTLPTNREV